MDRKAGGRYDIQPVPVGKDCVSTLCSQCGDSLVYSHFFSAYLFISDSGLLLSYGIVS